MLTLLLFVAVHVYTPGEALKSAVHSMLWFNPVSGTTREFSNVHCIKAIKPEQLREVQYNAVLASCTPSCCLH